MSLSVNKLHFHACMYAHHAGWSKELKWGDAETAADSATRLTKSPWPPHATSTSHTDLNTKMMSQFSTHPA